MKMSKITLYTHTIIRNIFTKDIIINNKKNKT